MLLKHLALIALAGLSHSIFLPTTPMNGDNANANKALTDAIYASDDKALRAAIKAGASLGAESHNHFSPLHLAIFSLQGPEGITIIRTLIEQDADINELSRDRSPLLLAITERRNHSYNSRPKQAALSFEVIRLLIESGADVNVGNPLFQSLLDKDLETFEMLLEAGADPNRIRIMGHSILEFSTRTNSNFTRLMIEYGADFNTVSENEKKEVRKEILHAFKNDPILQAIALRETSQAEDLLIKLYHTDFPEEALKELTERLNEIFLLSIAQNNSPIIHLLVNNFSSYISLDDGLVIAARQGNLDLVREFNERLQTHASPQHLSLALLYAAQGGFLEIVEYLLHQVRSNTQVELLPALHRVERLARYPGPDHARYELIYSLIMHEVLTRGTERILTTARAGTGGSPFLELPTELRSIIAEHASQS